MTLVVLWTNSIHGFTLITLLFPETCPWNSVEMCRITLVVLWTNFTHGFILITLLFPQKCPWNSVEMSSMTLVVLWTNSTHGFTLITLLFRKNLLGGNEASDVNRASEVTMLVSIYILSLALALVLSRHAEPSKGGQKCMEMKLRMCAVAMNGFLQYHSQCDATKKQH